MRPEHEALLEIIREFKHSEDSDLEAALNYIQNVGRLTLSPKDKRSGETIPDPVPKDPRDAAIVLWGDGTWEDLRS